MLQLFSRDDIPYAGKTVAFTVILNIENKRCMHINVWNLKITCGSTILDSSYATLLRVKASFILSY